MPCWAFKVRLIIQSPESTIKEMGLTRREALRIMGLEEGKGALTLRKPLSYFVEAKQCFVTYPMFTQCSETQYMCMLLDANFRSSLSPVRLYN